MKKILKNVLLFSALIGSVNCLALPAAAVDVATATSYMETTDDSKYPSSGTCASGATWGLMTILIANCILAVLR